MKIVTAFLGVMTVVKRNGVNQVHRHELTHLFTYVRALPTVM